jgi:hypothetical protein
VGLTSSNQAAHQSLPLRKSTPQKVGTYTTLICGNHPLQKRGWSDVMVYHGRSAGIASPEEWTPSLSIRARVKRSRHSFNTERVHTVIMLVFMNLRIDDRVRSRKRVTNVCWSWVVTRVGSLTELRNEVGTPRPAFSTACSLLCRSKLHIDGRRFAVTAVLQEVNFYEGGVADQGRRKPVSLTAYASTKLHYRHWCRFAAGLRWRTS